MNDDPAMGDTVVVERLVKAPPDTVFAFFTDPVRWRRWQGVDAAIDPRPDGVFRVNVRGDGYASGRVLHIDPPHRIVFTWGWEMDGNPMPPGSTVVEIDLLPDPAGTLVRLTHRGLPDGMREPHAEGWAHYLDRLTVTAVGDDPGPDPWLTGSPER
jgi:uncharacterized protein YndB with AHSA1/START domain